MEVFITIVAVIWGLVQIGLLTGIFFRLGRGAARMEELFRRVIQLEERYLDHAKAD